MSAFKDNFSKQSEIYSKFRPTYPPELFEYLASLTTDHDLAWDCGTGNGQSAAGLTKYYKSIYATDPSEAQIANAIRHPRILYKVEKAEQTGLEDESVDLITVAQALHWFDLNKFYVETKRVLKGNGVIAAWTYHLPEVSPDIDQVVKHFHDVVLDEFWRYENRLVDLRYSSIPFPFKLLPDPQFEISRDLTLYDLIGLINTWSAVQRFKDQNKENPVKKLEGELSRLWVNPHEKRPARWKIVLKIGIV